MTHEPRAEPDVPFATPPEEIVAPSPRSSLTQQWAGVFLAPATFAARLQLAYVVVPWSCARQDGRLWLHVISALAVVLAAVGCLIALRVWRSEGGDEPGEGGGRPARARFLGVVGLGMGALLTLLLLAQWVEVMVYSPCQ